MSEILTDVLLAPWGLLGCPFPAWLKSYGGSATNRKNFCAPVMKLV
jgi:hypothetical protein